jgi:hypothetical protein
VSSSAAIPLAPSHSNAPVAHRDRLADFTAGPRLLVLSLMALVVGVISAFVARALVWLIGVFTNLAYYQRFSSELVSPADNHLGYWAVLVPMVGGLIVGLMARYGTDRIRGHGYLGRTGIAAAWQLLLNEEEVREPGWLTAQGRLFRMQVRRVLGRFSAP